MFSAGLYHARMGSILQSGDSPAPSSHLQLVKPPPSPHVYYTLESPVEACITFHSLQALKDVTRRHVQTNCPKSSPPMKAINSASRRDRSKVEAVTFQMQEWQSPLLQRGRRGYMACVFCHLDSCGPLLPLLPCLCSERAQGTGEGEEAECHNRCSPFRLDFQMYLPSFIKPSKSVASVCK